MAVNGLELVVPALGENLCVMDVTYGMGMKRCEGVTSSAYNILTGGD